MANDLNIESLSIEFQVTSASAMDAVDKLVEKMNKLKAATQGGLQGASSMAKSLEKIAQAAKSFNGVDMSKLTGLSDAMTRLNGITASGNLAGVAAQMRDLARIGNTVAGLPSVASGQLQTITGISSALQSLANIPRLPDLSSTARSLTQLGSVASSITAVDMSAAAQKIRELTSALRPLETLGKTNLSSFINSLKKLPDISATLSAMDMTAFAGQIQSVATAISPLTAEIQRMAAAVGALPQPIQNAVAGLMNYNNTARQAGSSTDGLLRKIKNLLSLGSIIAITRRIKSLFGGMIESSNMFVENMNLFAVSMGDAADEALNFANRVNQLMGIDVSQWIQNQGYFKQIASGFGVVEDKANLMSQDLTQLGYDISSFFNISVEDAMLKLQSGISGELEPLRRVGYALDIATLQQVAYNHGINESIQNMTQAQKSQIRYIAIMEQSKNAMGDMARTLDSPANQMRIFEQRVDQFKRAIGNGLMPIISAALPWVTAFVKLLTEGAQKIADFLGFEIPKFDYGDLVAQSNKGVSSSFDDATKAAKEFKGTLSSIDQLNIIGSDTESSQKGIGDMYDLNVDLPSYDFLGGLEESTDKAYNTLKAFGSNVKDVITNVLPWLESFGTGIAVALAGIKIPKAVSAAWDWLKATVPVAFGSLKTFLSSKKGGIVGGLAAGATSGMLLFNSIKRLITGTGDLANNWAMFGTGVAVAGGAIAAFIALGNPVGAVITGVVAGVGAIAGAVAGANEEIKKSNQIVTDNILYRNGGTKITDIANAFDKWAGAATAVNRQTIEKYQQLSEYDTKIDGVLQTMQELDGINLDFSSITPADAEKLKEPFSNLVTYLKGDFQTDTQKAADDLKQIFTDLGIDKTLSDQIQTAYKQLQIYFDETLSDAQKEVGKYLDVLSNNGTLTEAEMASFQKNYNLTLDLARLDNPEYQNVQLAMSELSDLDLSNIDFENDPKAQSAIEKIRETMNSYYSSQLELYNEQTRNTALQKLRIETIFEASDKTEEDIRKYNEQMGLLELSDLMFALNYNVSIDKLQSQLDTILGRASLELDKASKSIMPTFKDWYFAISEGLIEGYNVDQMSEAAKTIASGNWLLENSLAQQITDISTDMYAQVKLDIIPPREDTSAYEIYRHIGESGIIPLTVELAVKTKGTSKVDMSLYYDWLNSNEPQYTNISTDKFNPPYKYIAPTSEAITKTEGYDINSVMEVAQIMGAVQGDNAQVNDIYLSLNVDGSELAQEVILRDDWMKMLSNGR